jgi:biopolymer transport protein ExbD
LVEAVSGNEPHLGQLIAQLLLLPVVLIGAVYAPTHIIDHHAIPWSIESDLDAIVETSPAKDRSTKAVAALTIVSDSIVRVDGNPIRINDGFFFPIVNNWITQQPSSPSELVWVIRAAPNITHSSLINVLGAAKHAGVQHFHLLGIDDE